MHYLFKKKLCIRMNKTWDTDNTKCWRGCVWSNRNSHSLLMGLQNGTATLKDSLVVSYKSNNSILSILSSSQTPCY